MHRRSQDFWLGKGGETVYHMQQRHQQFSKRGTFCGTKNERSEAGSLVLHLTRIFLKGKTRTASYKILQMYQKLETR